MVSDALAVACGAVCGALARHNIALVATQHALAPWHIAGINTAGSAVLGAVAAAPLPPPPPLASAEAVDEEGPPTAETEAEAERGVALAREDGHCHDGDPGAHECEG